MGTLEVRGADEESNSKAKFIIFRLEDPNSPGVFASNGSASVRLDPDGIVAEVSGLNEGQAVEDALVPIVKEKALSLPGGEGYLQKFEDKQALIRLDKKMEKGEDLTKEELSFLYELDRPIATLDTYNSDDPRIPELKEKYDLEYALEKGVDTNKLVPRLDYSDIKNYLGTLLEHGADININQLTSELDPVFICDYLGTLLEHGADINKITNRLKPTDIFKNFDFLLKYGADININQLVSKLRPLAIYERLDTFLEHGADVNIIINKLNKLDEDAIKKNIDLLRKYGANL